MTSKVLILGGYGNFGKYIARTLLQQHQIPIIFAGRKPHLLEQERAKLSAEFKGQSVETTILDINSDTREYLNKVNPKVVINTCGPFQSANYSIVRNCIDSRVNYIDLADGRDFVKGMHQFHDKAKANDTTVITGASSVPGLSSAVVEHYGKEFKQIDSLWYGISPGQRTNRGGEATVKGVMGYIGRPIAPFGNLTQPIYGWQDLYAQRFPELGQRLMSNCEVPDLDIFPSKYGINNLRFSAGTESKTLHTSIFLVSWLIRFGVPINLAKYSNLLLNMSHSLFDWMGTDEGGMYMKFTGLNQQGKQMILKWYIIVRKGHGPNVPVVPAIVLANKICKQNFSLPGVHTCTGLITLQQYLEGLKNFDFTTYVERELVKT